MRTVAWFVARRYLFSRGRGALEWLVLGIAMGGVALAVATVILVVSVFSGLRGEIFSRIVSFTPHLEIDHPDWRNDEPTTDVLGMIRSDPGVLRAEPVFYVGALLQGGKGSEGFNRFVRIYGFDRLERDNLFSIAVPADPVELQRGTILVTDQYARLAEADGRVLAISEAVIPSPVRPIPKAMLFRVAGSFSTQNELFDERHAFVSLPDARELAMRRRGINYVHVILKDPLAPQPVQARLQGRLPNGTIIRSWTDDFGRMFSDLRVLQGGMWLVMLMTMLIAALNIVGTLVLIVIQKTREIGILKGMGASQRLIGRIFLLEGVLLGICGAALGGMIGSLGCMILSAAPLPIPGGLWELRTIPVRVQPPIILVILAVSVLICTLAAAAPARRAARLNPVEALRYE